MKDPFVPRLRSFCKESMAKNSREIAPIDFLFAVHLRQKRSSEQQKKEG